MGTKTQFLDISNRADSPVPHVTQAYSVIESMELAVRMWDDLVTLWSTMVTTDEEPGRCADRLALMMREKRVLFAIVTAISGIRHRDQGYNTKAYNYERLHTRIAQIETAALDAIKHGHSLGSIPSVDLDALFNEDVGASEAEGAELPSGGE